MHPLGLFHYCPKCGSSHFKDHDFKSRKCADCGFTFYLNPSAATAAFILNDKNQLLIARRLKDPAKGTYDLPGGFTDLNETAEEAIIREIKEETSLSLSNPKYLFSLPNIYLYSGFEVHTVDLFFEFRLNNDPVLQPADDVSELFFLTKDAIDPAKFGLTSIRKAIEIWLSS